MQGVQLIIPARPEYVTTLRLVTASVAQKMGFDIEAIDDLRVSVSEAVNYLWAANEEIEISFEEQIDRLTIDIRANLEETSDEGTKLHHQIMESLMDEVHFAQSSLSMTKIL
ncbi:MAG: ATP-binding protein [Peptoniphilaceae bacterium]|nr:ATP-binding protein [Peptoniphilaceae bacterium]MDY6085315.1 ATP-binding protein [Peptoniphilaceae bacterium]